MVQNGFAVEHLDLRSSMDACTIEGKERQIAAGLELTRELLSHKDKTAFCPTWKGHAFSLDLLAMCVRGITCTNVSGCNCFDQFLGTKRVYTKVDLVAERRGPCQWHSSRRLTNRGGR